jgi:hypothetical protein
MTKLCQLWGCHLFVDQKCPVQERPVEVARVEQKVSFGEAVKRVEDDGSRLSNMALANME